MLFAKLNDNFFYIMIIGKLDQSLLKNTKETERYIHLFSTQFLKNFFYHARRNKDDQNHINKIQEYLKQENFGNINLYNILYSMIYSISITDNLLLITCNNNSIKDSNNIHNNMLIKKNYKYKENFELLYRLITFGNRDIPPWSIIKDALNYSVKKLMVMKKYGY